MTVAGDFELISLKEMYLSYYSRASSTVILAISFSSSAPLSPFPPNIHQISRSLKVFS